MAESQASAEAPKALNLSTYLSSKIELAGSKLAQANGDKLGEKDDLLNLLLVKGVVDGSINLNEDVGQIAVQKASELSISWQELIRNETPGFEDEGVKIQGGASKLPQEFKDVASELNKFVVENHQH